MDIKNINVFEVVAREKSITKASKFLYMTPQGVSKIIRNLEKEYDCELFQRKGNKFELTESGECFFKHMKKIEAVYYNMEIELMSIHQKNQRIVDLLSAYGILRLVTPECLIVFKEKHPEIEFYYREYPDYQVERLFDNQEGNIVFTISNFDSDKYDVTVLESFKIKLLVHKDHPLAKKSHVSIKDLKGEPLYIENRDFRIHHIIVDACKDEGFSPNIIFETSGFSLCHKMVKRKKGISVTVDFVFDDMKESNLVMVPFVAKENGEYPLMWSICMLIRKHQIQGKAVEIFYQHVKEWMQAIHDGRIKR